MKVTFISNFLTHHQIPFSNSMYKLLGKDYSFVSTLSMDDERKGMGWEINADYTYEVKAYKSEVLMQKARELANESDVVIIGSAPDLFIEQRLKESKLTFKYSERLYKQGLSLGNLPRAIVSSYIHHGKFKKYPLYMLCASAFTARDLAIFGNYKQKTYKWGYFPELREHNIEELIRSKRGKVVKILWAGRFIGWKNPEQALIVAQRLDIENIEFQLKMIGNGEEFEKIKAMADNMSLNHSIEFLEVMTPDEVRKHMEETNIYLFTSDFNEGWGAVLNESMNSGCAVVASHAIGSVPFLIKNGENGLIYKNNDVDDLYEKVFSLVNDSEMCEILGKNAYMTIKSTWNSEVAADRFLMLSESLLNGDVLEYKYGPCSKAELIKNNWFNGGVNLEEKT